MNKQFITLAKIQRFRYIYMVYNKVVAFSMYRADHSRTMHSSHPWKRFGYQEGMFLRRHSEARFRPASWIHNEARIRLLELSHLQIECIQKKVEKKTERKSSMGEQRLDKTMANLFPTAGAVVVFVPEAVHGRTKEADAHHEGHHASHN